MNNLIILFYSYNVVYTHIDNNTLESIRYNDKICNHNTIVNIHIGYSHTLLTSCDELINLVTTQTVNFKWLDLAWPKVLTDLMK